MVVSSETINKMFSNTTIKDKHANPMVKSSMVEGILIIVQSKPIAYLVAITPSLITTIVGIGINVKVEEKKATMVE